MLKDKWRSLSSLRKRLFALALAAAVLSTSISIGYFAVNADTDQTERVITAFEELSEDIAYQKVPVGGSENDIIFPKELKVYLYSETETGDDKAEPFSVPLDPESVPAGSSDEYPETPQGSEDGAYPGTSDQNEDFNTPGNSDGEYSGDDETGSSSEGDVPGAEDSGSGIPASDAGDTEDSENKDVEPGGAEPGGTGPGGAEPGGTEPGGTEPEGTEPEGTEAGDTETGGGSEPQSPGGQDAGDQGSDVQKDDEHGQNVDDQNPQEQNPQEQDSQGVGLDASAIIKSLFTVQVHAAELPEGEEGNKEENTDDNEEGGAHEDTEGDSEGENGGEPEGEPSDPIDDDEQDENAPGSDDEDAKGDSSNKDGSDSDGESHENDDSIKDDSSKSEDDSSETGSSDKGEESGDNKEDEMKELSAGVPKVLKGVTWKLEGYRSAYGNKFQAVRTGDVFIYVPDIEAYDLICDASLPEIRVTIVEPEEPVVEEPEGELFSQFMIVDGIKIELKAPKGVFPEDAMLVVKKIDNPSDNEKIKKVISEDMGLNTEEEPSSTEEGEKLDDELSFLSFDISVIGKDGEELQPNTEFGEATVTFYNIKSIGGGSGEAVISVYHFDDGLDSADSLGVDGSGDAVSVTAEHFSTYVVASSRRGVSPAEGSVLEIRSSKSDLGLIKDYQYYFPEKGNTAFGSEFTVVPANAKKKDIIWSLSPAPALNADRVFTAGAGGVTKYTLTATIIGGKIDSKGVASNYTQSFDIPVTDTALVIGELEYFKMQAKDTIDAYFNNQQEITILPIRASDPKYMILSDFVTSKEALDAKKNWSDYDPGSKPALFKNKVNYVYARIGGSGGTYISSRCIIEDEIKPVITAVTAKQTGTQATVSVTGSDELSGIRNYYVLAKKSSDPAPSANDIINNPSVQPNQSGVFTIQNLQANTAYIFYAVIMDNAGNISDVAKSGLGALSAVIKVEDHEYKTMQGKDAIDDCYKEQKEIEISLTVAGASATIEYYIADSFYSATAALEKAVNGAWSTYNPDNKPALKQNKVNYIYARITPPTGDPFYLSSRGIWEDEKPPKVSSVKGTPKDTTAEVTVKGTDGESGVEYYYVLVKKRDEAAPSKPKDVRDSGKKTDDGLFSIDGLEAKTNYTMYAVVQDRAGNLSEIKTGKLTTKKSIAADAAAAGGAGGAGAGAAGAGAGAGGADALKPGESNVDKRTADAEKEKQKEEEKEDKGSVRDRVPFIDDASEGILIGREKTSGWDRIEEETVKCTAPAEIVIDMNGSTEVPVAMLHDFAERDVTVYFRMDEKSTWVLNGLSYTELPKDDVDFRVRLDTKNIPAQKVNELADVYPHLNFTLSHDGDFGFTALLRLNVGETNHGLYANLYYYNEDKKELEYVNSSPVDNNGYGVFEFTHASDYTVIIRGDAVTGSKSVLSSEASEEAEEKFISAETMTKSGSSKIWLIVISVLSILLCIAILFAPDEKKRRTGAGKA